MPWGVSFDEQTGTFSGMPDTAGEYTVPVTVETNYGRDTKDVLIDVTKAYPVYAIGNMAATWSEDAEPDEYGFRKINIPDARKLLNHYGGFGAKVSNGDYYCCGVYGINPDVSSLVSALLQANTPYNMGGIDETRVIRLYHRVSYQGGYNSTSEGYMMLIRTGSNVVGTPSRTYVYTETNDGSPPKQTWIVTNLPAYVYDVYKLIEPEVSTLVGTNSSNDQSSAACVLLNTFISGGGRKGAGIIFGRDYDFAFSGTNTFDCDVKKLFPTYLGSRTYGTRTNSYDYLPIFHYLSNDGLLENDASKFTDGIIKDAWVFQKKAYVQTEDNLVYEATGKRSAYSWSVHGLFDVKKVELPSETIVFMLTNDGKLYHKGSAVTNVTDEHSEFTQIFPDCYIYDFTFGGSTLTVLKE